MKKTITTLCALAAFAQVMSADISWTFPPDTLSSTSVNSSSPQIGMDTNGNIVAVWLENTTLKASVKKVGMAWSSSVTLSSAAATFPQVVMDPSGNSTAIWVESNVIKASSKTLSGNWGTATTISPTGATTPDLAVDSAGDVVAVWATSTNIRAATKQFGGSWATSVNIGTGGNNPHVGFGGVGATRTIAAVWHNTVNGIDVIRAATRLFSGSWSTELTISDPLHRAGNPRVAIDNNGNATAVWFEYDQIGTQFYNVTAQAGTILAGGTWSAPITLSNQGMRDPTNLGVRVCYDNAGNTIALWNNSYDGSSFNIESASRPVRGDWSAPATLINSNNYAYKAELTLTDVGNALSVYMFSNGIGQLIQSSQMDISGYMTPSWAVPANVSLGNSNAYPQVTSSTTGNTMNVAAAWINYDGAHNLVVASTGTQTLVLPPSGLNIAQSSTNFGVYTEYYNTLTWTASTDPTAVEYAIYRNGSYIDQVPAGTTSYIDHNATQSGSVTYGVSAVNNINSESRVILESFP